MMQPSSNSAAREQFYERLWHSESLGSDTPNPTEAERLRLIQLLLDHARKAESLGQPWRILDAGCGRGWLSPHLSIFGKTLGIDPLRASIDTARSRFPHLDFEVATVGELAPASFDVVVSSEVIEHVDDQAEYLKGIATVLKHRGFLILTTPRGEMYDEFTRVFPREQQQPVEKWLDRASLIDLCKQTDLELLAERRIFELFTTTGSLRPFASPKLAKILTSLPLTRSMWNQLRRSRSLYFCGLFRKGLLNA